MFGPKRNSLSTKVGEKEMRKIDDITCADSKWTKSEEEQLRQVHLKIDPRLPNYWEKVVTFSPCQFHMIVRIYIA